jgi:hypothetical protein
MYGEQNVNTGKQDLCELANTQKPNWNWGNNFRFCKRAGSPFADVATCQDMSNIYGTDAGRTFGCAPQNYQDWWKKSNCQTRPTVTTFAGCSKKPSGGECGWSVAQQHSESDGQCIEAPGRNRFYSNVRSIAECQRICDGVQNCNGVTVATNVNRCWIYHSATKLTGLRGSLQNRSDRISNVKLDCGKQCCKAMTAECLSCESGVSVDEYCHKNPGTVGCPTLTGFNPKDGKCPSGYEVVSGAIAAGCKMFNECKALSKHKKMCILPAEDVDGFCSKNECPLIAQSSNAGFNKK